MKTGGRGKAGGVKVADDAGRRRREGQRHPRHGHQGPHGPQGARRAGQRHRGGVLLLLPARPREPHLPRDLLRRGRHGDRGGRRTSARRRSPRSPVDAARPASTGPRPREIAAAGGLPEDVARRRRRAHREALVRLRRRGRHAGRGQPADPDGRRPGDRAGRQGHPRRQRRLPPRRTTRRSPTRPPRTRWRPRPRRRTSTTSSSTATSASSATAPGLVMSTLDVVAYAGEESRRRQARPTSSTSAAAPRPR